MNPIHKQTAEPGETEPVVIAPSPARLDGCMRAVPCHYGYVIVTVATLAKCLTAPGQSACIGG